MEKEGIRLILTEDEGRRLFSEQLPREGKIEKVYAGKLHNPWCLFRFDEGFDYQIEDKEKKSFRGFRVERALIRSRWQGHHIGGKNPTSVFVLLTDDEQKFETDEIHTDDFYFESWAMCTTQADQPLTRRGWQRLWRATS